MTNPPINEDLSEPVRKETLPETLARLSLLSPLEYEQVREAEARRLNLRRVTVLDDEVSKKRDAAPAKEGSMVPTIQPWHEPVNGNVLLSEILGTIKRFIVCSHETAVSTTLWIAMTWVVDHIQVCPLAIITAPEKRCGKSLLLNLMGRLSCRPLMASNISSAVIYRVLEAERPTLLIDEADTFMKDNEQMRGIINSGHAREHAYIFRIEGDKFLTKRFSTWGAQAISGIGVLPDTLMDRSILMKLRRKLPNEAVERLRHTDCTLFTRLSSMLARWALDHGPTIGLARPELPAALNDRAQDNWEPLLAIASCAQGNWPSLALNAALKVSGTNDAHSKATLLLADIHGIFQRRNVDRISSNDLLSELIAGEEAAWATYDQGRPMGPRQLSTCLSGYGIKPNSIRIGDATPKGYMRKDFDDVFARYLPSPATLPMQSATSQQTTGQPETDAVDDVADDLPCCGNTEPSETYN